MNFSLFMITTMINHWSIIDHISEPMIDHGCDYQFSEKDNPPLYRQASLFWKTSEMMAKIYQGNKTCL